MFGTWFYHKRVRTAVSIFGSLFNNLYILRQTNTGSVISQIKVPLSYAPKRNFIERLNEMSKGEDAERMVAMKLPRMSFEITDISYDGSRQLPKTNSISKSLSSDNTRKTRFYTAVPYNIGFQLNIYAKSQDDCLQMVEQILPYFTPQYSVTVKPFSDYPDILEDVPILLESVAFEDNYDGVLEQRRTIVYTLNFTMKVSFYGPTQNSSIIRAVNNNVFSQGAGLADSDVFLNRIRVTPSPEDVSIDSDYSFNISYLDSSA